MFNRFGERSISVILKPQKKLSVAVLLGQEIWRSGILMDQLPSWIEVRILLYLAER
jgi:hypothetical protein